MVGDATFVLPAARGDTFVFAEDDDELFEGTTPSPFTPDGRQLNSRRQPISDFSQRLHRRPASTVEMTKPPRRMDTISQNVPGMQMTPIPQIVPSTDDPPAMTATPEPDATAETTPVPITTATTEAPDPDAVVCSGRPFDSFMQLKNGSTYAFRGE